MDKKIIPKTETKNESMIKNPMIKNPMIVDTEEEEFDKDYFRGGTHLNKVYKVRDPSLKIELFK
jgi:hypothetical protein